MTTLTTNYLTPTGREEAWRFTPLKRLGGLHDGTAVIADRHSLSLGSASVAGVSFALVSAADTKPISESDDVIVARIRDFAKEVSVLTIAANTEVAEPIFLKRSSVALDSAEFSRVLIRVENHARATVIIENSGDTHLAEDLEISVAPGASLTLVSLASCELLGVYFATSGQFFEHRMFVDHKVPNAKSRVNYKGALAGDQAHTVWIGDVFIRAAAEGTDTYELNRNLLLSDGARADSVPNLEIETGEIVGAGHASTTGRFDDEQLFYLMSRGITLADARRLVVRGFFNEIVSEIGNEEIQTRLMDRIDSELAKAGA